MRTSEELISQAEADIEFVFDRREALAAHDPQAIEDCKPHLLAALAFMRKMAEAHEEGAD